MIYTCPRLLINFISHTLCRTYIHDVYWSCYFLNPILIWKKIGCQHIVCHFHESSILSLCNTIFLWCIQHSELFVNIMNFTKFLKFSWNVFTTCEFLKTCCNNHYDSPQVVWTAENNPMREIYVLRNKSIFFLRNHKKI